MKRTNRLLPPVIISLLLCFCVGNAHADRILYSYDSSGNRISRQKEILIRGSEQDAEEDKDKKSEPMQEDLSDHRITIYPNPTQGNFSVEITGAGSLEGASITIYNMSGRIIYYNGEPQVTNEIDITVCNNGLYLLVIRVDGESSTWKIIKI